MISHTVPTNTKVEIGGHASAPAKYIGNKSFDGAPGVTRTRDLLIRSQTLYPTELRAHPEVRQYYSCF